MIKENRWTGRWRGKRGVVYFVVFTLVMLAIGFGWGLVSERALGSQPQGRASSAVLAQADDHDAVEKSYCCTPKKFAKKFRAGKYKRAHGLPMKKLFANPKVGKRVFVNKITRQLQQTCRTGNEARVPCRAVRMCDRCQAYEMLQELVENANCSGRGEPRDADYICNMKYPGGGPRLTKKQVQIGGSAILCGGSVAIAVRGGAGLFAGIWGGVACGWAFWQAIDDD